MAINTKDLIQSKLPSESVNALSVPKPTDELANVESLNSKNLVDSDNQPLPSKIKDQKIAEGVDKNTPGIKDCITQKVKDLAGIFTVSYGIPTIDQFSSSNIGGSFTTAFKSIKTTFTDTVSSIKNVFKRKKQNNLDQVETGGLTLKKFLGCEEANVNFTSRERVQAQTQPEIITEKIDSGTKQSQEALTKQANNNVEQRVQPPANKSKQVDVPIITEVEKAPPIPWDYYSIRVYRTPVSEDAEIGTLNALVDAGVDIIDSFSGIKDPEEFVISVVNDVMNQNYKYVYDIVSEKDQNPDIATYDVNEIKNKKAAIRKLPAGYFTVTLEIDNKDYFKSPSSGFYGADNTYIIVGTYKKPGAKVSYGALSILTDYRGFGENTYIQADQQSVNGIFKGKNGENRFTSEIRNGKASIILEF